VKIFTSDFEFHLNLIFKRILQDWL